jgi:hypothetical protein
MPAVPGPAGVQKELIAAPSNPSLNDWAIALPLTDVQRTADTQTSFTNNFIRSFFVFILVFAFLLELRPEGTDWHAGYAIMPAPYRLTATMVSLFEGRLGPSLTKARISGEEDHKQNYFWGRHYDSLCLQSHPKRSPDCFTPGTKATARPSISLPL